MFKCIANNENMFLVLDTIDGVCEWTSIQQCRDYLERGIIITGLSLVKFDRTHSYIKYVPSKNFIPRKIVEEFKRMCSNTNDCNNLVNIAKSYILAGNNILLMRASSNSYTNFINNLLRWCYDNGR